VLFIYIILLYTIKYEELLYQNEQKPERDGTLAAFDLLFFSKQELGLPSKIWLFFKMITPIFGLPLPHRLLDWMR
jgi:hypothetical protein